MKAYLVASVSALVLAAGIAYAGPPMKMPAPNPNIRMLNAPDCATGFMKTRASGDPKGSHRFYCVTETIKCASPTHTQEQPVRQVGTKAVQFAYECSWSTATQQQSDAAAAQVCAPGFAKTLLSNQGVTSTLTGTNSANKNTTSSTSTMWRGAYKCTTPVIQCPPPPAGLSGAAGMEQPSELPTGVGAQQIAKFSYGCIYQQIN